MKSSPRFTNLARLAVVLALVGLNSFANAQSRQSQNKGPGNVVVHPKFGGTILGFDVDQNGDEGVLSEFITVGQNCPFATETFDLATGKILKVVSQGEGIGCLDSEVTWGVAGTSVGLVEHQHSPGVGKPLQMVYGTLNPLEQNQINGTWTPPFHKHAYIAEVSRNQGTPINAYVVYDVQIGLTYLFGSDVAKNAFGPVVQIDYDIYGYLGLNTKTNAAVLASNSDPFGPTEVTLVNLATDKVTQFNLGMGTGSIAGIAVDSDDDLAVVATLIQAQLTFYDLKNQTGFTVVIPTGSCIPEACAPADVEYDPIHKLFLVAQPLDPEDLNASAIYVYDTQGNLEETLQGFQFTGAEFDLFPPHIALHPSDRSGFVDVTNSSGVGAIQSFTY